MRNAFPSASALLLSPPRDRAGRRRPWIRRQHLLVTFFALCLFLLARPAASVYVGVMPCGGTVPIDSQFMFDPLWSLSPRRDIIRQTSGVDLRVGKQDMPAAVRAVIKAEAGMDPGAVTVFRLGLASTSQSQSSVSDEGTPSEGSSPTSSGSGAEAAGTVCEVSLDPLRAALQGTTATAARLVFLRVRPSAGSPDRAVCGEVVPLSLSLGNATVNVTVFRTEGETPGTIDTVSSTETTSTFPFTQAIGVGGGGNGDGKDETLAWPVRLSFPAACELEVLLLVNRHGRIDPWYVWIPTTVYTAVITALMIPAFLVTIPMPTALVAVEMILVFLGYVGACIGLVVELICWQSSLGRMFPFPASVTLYACLSVLYAIYFLPLVYRRHHGDGHYRVLLMGVLRLLVYGLNCALCVGYWVCGYVLLGSLALFQYVATNVILTFYFAKVTVRLRRVAVNEGTVKFAYAYMYLWFLPATPFAACGLMYTDLYALSRLGETKRPGDARVRDVVYVYNAQMSLPLLFFQNIYGIALMAAASAFHMPFVVVLFMALWLFGLHVIYTCDTYLLVYRHWREKGLVNMANFTWCGILWLTPIMDFLLQRGRDGEGAKNRRRSGVELPLPQGTSLGGEIVYNSAFTGSPPRSVDPRAPESERRRASWAVSGRRASRAVAGGDPTASPTLPWEQPPEAENPPYRHVTRATTEWGDEDVDMTGQIYFPPMPHHGGAVGSERGRSALSSNPPPVRANVGVRAEPMQYAEDEEDGEGEESAGVGMDSLVDEARTPINQGPGDDPADARFWPTSVER